MDIANLHDAFMNANLQFVRMRDEQVLKDPEEFMTSDRGRFERTWLAFLYVLIESWQSAQMATARALVAERVPDSAIEDLLAEGRASDAIAALQDVRHYMCHRDRREYWDEGRTSVAENLDYNVRLHTEFGRVLLLTLQSMQDGG
jgi:hypothetical protein